MGKGENIVKRQIDYRETERKCLKVDRQTEKESKKVKGQTEEEKKMSKTERQI